MVNQNPAAAQIIPGPYIGYNRLNQPTLTAQRLQLAPQPQQPHNRIQEQTTIITLS